MRTPKYKAMPILNSRFLKIFIDGAAVACSTDAQISTSAEYRDTTCKDSNGNQEGEYGLISGSASTSFLEDLTGSNFAGLRTAQDARTKVTVMYSTEQSGFIFHSCQAIITQLDSTSSGTEQNVTGSASFQFTGPITTGTVA